LTSREGRSQFGNGQVDGSEHCQGDNRMLGATYVSDWLADRLVKGAEATG